MKLSLKELKLVAKWFDAASTFENLDNADIKLFNKIEEYIDDNDSYIEDNDTEEDLDIDNDDTEEDLDNDDSSSRFKKNKDEYDIYDIEEDVEEDY